MKDQASTASSSFVLLLLSRHFLYRETRIVRLHSAVVIVETPS